MNLESIAKFFAPKSPMLSDSPRATASDSLTGTDVMAALGLTSAKCGFGFDLYLSKIGVSTPDIALEKLYEQAEKLAGKFKSVSALDDDNRQLVLRIMCNFAYQDYARSAASVRECDECHGSRFIEAEVFTNKVNYPWGKAPQWAKMSRAVVAGEWEQWKQVREIVKVKCPTCNGKGVISNSCRCHGKGKVVDREKSEILGIPVMKECDKCSGRGYSRIPAETVRKAICDSVMQISQPTWSRGFKPFYEMLITQCHIEEAQADSALMAVTR